MSDSAAKEPTFTLLNGRGEFHARGVSISDMMDLMVKRWGGTLICDKTGAVLFNIETDSPRGPTDKVRAAQRHADSALAWARWHALQEYGK